MSQFLSRFPFLTIAGGLRAQSDVRRALYPFCRNFLDAGPRHPLLAWRFPMKKLPLIRVSIVACLGMFLGAVAVSCGSFSSGQSGAPGVDGGMSSGGSASSGTGGTVGNGGSTGQGGSTGNGGSPGTGGTG